MLFDIKPRRCDLIDGKLYIEFIPSNEEIKDIIYNGGIYDIINNSAQETIDSVKSTVRNEMYNLLPDDIKTVYKNAQFKLNNSIEDPSHIDYDVLGFHKKRTFVKGELRSVEYYRNYTSSSNTYSDLVVSEFRTYVRDSINLVIYRDMTCNWILSDNTTGLTLNFRKYYTPEESIKEGVDRRENLLAFAKTTLLDGLKGIYGEPANQHYAFDMLTSVKTQMEYFSQGYTQPLRDAVSASTKPYLTVGIKEAILEQLTF
ncbi:MAG: hypothetical protein KatS3mg035_1100 [Bacteroidia bacterium]|nr:MAG: hypothetical protein KatS3mg035_1100 [Bacteroidia bacterium]